MSSVRTERHVTGGPGYPPAVKAALAPKFSVTSPQPGKLNYEQSRCPALWRNGRARSHRRLAEDSSFFVLYTLRNGFRHIMSPTAFAARRRTARSSSLFQTSLLTALILCILVVWWNRPAVTYSPNSGSRLSHLEKPRGLVAQDVMTNMPKQPDGAEIPFGASLRVGLDTTTQPAFMPLRIATFNIRYATSSPSVGEQPWSVRCPKLCTQLKFIAAGQESPFLCLQECLYSQLNDIQDCLGKSWSHVGRGRDNDPKDGEFSPIFYRSDVWRCLRYETRWLSKTPDHPSRGWDAILNRIVTMAEFEHRVTRTKVVVMSTHFDNVGVEARMNSAKLLIKFAEEWRDGKGAEPSAAVLIGGDFNSPPDDGAYQVMTAKGSGISDISDLLPEKEKYGNHVTYTSFGEPNQSSDRIDFLFIQEPRLAKVKTFGVLANSFDDNVRISDHRPVVSDLEIPI